MITHGHNHSGRYRVSIHEALRAGILSMHKEEALAGRGETLLAAFRQILDRLKREPLRFGEPLYRLPGLELSIRQGSIRPLLVNYAVHFTRPLVFLRSLKLLD